MVRPSLFIQEFASILPCAPYARLGLLHEHNRTSTSATKALLVFGRGPVVVGWRLGFSLINHPWGKGSTSLFIGMSMWSATVANSLVICNVDELLWRSRARRADAIILHPSHFGYVQAHSYVTRTEDSR